MRLYCLPYSGASAMVYGRWRRSLPANIEVRPLELPGRGKRFSEPLATDMAALARQLAGEISLELDRPYALFGHSLGGLLVHELAHALRERGCPPPRLVFASGTAAPSQRDTERFTTNKTDAQLIADLRELNGTPEDLLANEELMRLTLPVLRADFALCGSYQYRPRPPLGCPIHVLAGREDSTTPEQLQAWRLETAGAFELSLFDSGHFFIHDRASDVLALIQARLQPLLHRHATAI